jgi:flagellar protein FlgJ
LRSIGQEQLAAALETGAVDAGSVVNAAMAAMQPQPKQPPIEVGGVLLDPTTYQPIFDSRKQEPGFTTLTAEETAGLNLPSGVYQRSADGKISQVGGGGTTVNIDNKAASKFEEEFAKGDAATLRTVYDAGLQATRNIGRIDQLEQLLQNVPTGATASIKQFAGEFGISTEGLNDIQSAQALINSLVPEQRQPGSGPMSDADLALFKQSLPRIINQPGGNQTIIGTMRAIAEYDAQGAAIVQQMREGVIDNATAFRMLQERENPLAQFKGQGGGSVPPASSPVRRKFNPQTGALE